MLQEALKRGKAAVGAFANHSHQRLRLIQRQSKLLDMGQLRLVPAILGQGHGSSMDNVCSGLVEGPGILFLCLENVRAKVSVPVQLGPGDRLIS